MGETHQQLHQHPKSSSSRLGMRSAGGEIVEVQGGHIVRSTGRKDRHSKVCTAKGPRDRRVRLSAHTAIQFYDVQDRLGYDRPSKAVDWLIKKAKAAIDELEELPAWTPTALTNEQREAEKHQMEENQELQMVDPNAIAGSSSSSAQNQQQQLQVSSSNSRERNSSFLPPSMDSDSIADTIKSFFPMGASTEDSSAVQFQSFPPMDLLNRTNSQSQDLRLSLQSLQDPNFLRHQHHHHHQQQQPPPPHQNPTHQTDQQSMFSGNSQLGFDTSAWSEHQAGELNRYQKMVAWNSGGDATGSSSGGGGFIFNTPTPPTPPLLQPLFGQNEFFSQRGPLQSSNTPSVRAWIDPSSFASDHHNHHHHHQLYQTMLPFHHPSSLSGIGFASGGGGFSGFRVPARIQGEEEEAHDGISDKPSSASSDSRH